jgi:ribosomal protein L9
MAKRSSERKNIEVILLQADKNLGEKHEIVKVKPIFAKNVLLPKKLAILADANNKNSYSQKIKA